MRHAFLCLLLFAVTACGGTGGVVTSPSELFVNAATGNDMSPGTVAEPLKTIAMALSKATSGQTVRVVPGTYDMSSGESFPLVIGAGVALVGAPTTKGGSPNLTEIIGGPNTDVGVVVGAGGSVAGFHIVAGTAVQLAGNQAECRDSMPSGIVGVAVDVGIQGVVIQGNIVFGGKVGVHFSSGSDGRVQENQISGNVTGVYVVDAQPDLGGGAYDSSGGNSIHQNSGNDMVIEGDLLLFARFNCWDHSPPTQSFMPGTADVILPPGAVLDTSPSSVCSGGI